MPHMKEETGGAQPLVGKEDGGHAPEGNNTDVIVDNEDDDDIDLQVQLGVLERLKQTFHLSRPKQRKQLLESFDLEGVAALIKDGKAKRILCMVGAGISVNAGIPDFRSPSTGLYSRLASFGLPHPEAIFEMSYFRHRPEPFFMLAKELLPGTYEPTPAHHFIRLLSDKGLLLRCFTQNVDSLETLAGVPPEQVVAAHGNFDTSHCIECRAEYSTDYVKEAVMGDKVCRCSKCGGLVKPDIVFFGEGLPPRFFQTAEQDPAQADLLIVMGTSLVVQPFASLIDFVDDDCPRLLINKEVVGTSNPIMALLGGSHRGFHFDKGNYRDALFLGDCDKGVRRLCTLLGWRDELEDLVTCAHMGHLSLDETSAAADAVLAPRGVDMAPEAARDVATHTQTDIDMPKGSVPAPSPPSARVDPSRTAHALSVPDDSPPSHVGAHAPEAATLDRSADVAADMGLDPMATDSADVAGHVKGSGIPGSVTSASGGDALYTPAAPG